MKKRSQVTAKPTRLEEQYEELMRLMRPTPSFQADSESLEQPSFLRVVATVTTYGAYEKPI